MSDDKSGPLQSVSWDREYTDSPIHGARAQLHNLKSVLRFCEKRRTAVDVGAHIGLWTGPLAERFHKVWAFEPVPQNMECLRHNVRASNVELIECALGEHAESLCEMTLPDRSNSGCWYAMPGVSTAIDSLDSFALQDVDLLKIDVEGAEGFVVKGAMETIRQSQPLIVFEDNGLGLKHYGKDWLDPRPILLSLGYCHIARIRKDEVWRSR